jgi:hypothetical protein
MGPEGIVEISSDQEESISRLVDMSVACQYLAAQCQVRPCILNQMEDITCYYFFY